MPPRRAHAVALIAASTLVMTACSTSSGLLIDGGSLANGGSAVCFNANPENGSAIFGVGLANESSSNLTITEVNFVSVNAVEVVEVALATQPADGIGWGTATTDDIGFEHLESWNTRREAVGAEVAAGEQAWLLLVVDNMGVAAEQRTGIRGVTVQYDGALWPRSTTNHMVYGFGPVSENCDAGLGAPEG